MYKQRLKALNIDILVIGAGVLGLSSALHLKRLNPGKEVFLVDRLSGPGMGNTAKSAGIYLNLFTTKLNYLLGDSTADWFHHLQEGRGHRLKLIQCGYLYLLDIKRYEKLQKPVWKARNLGVEIETYNKEELTRMIPDLSTNFGKEERELMMLNPVEAGVLGVKCGSIDTDALARALEAEFLWLGGGVSYNTEVQRIIFEPEKGLDLTGEPFVWQDLRVSGAITSRGEIQAETTVVAAGVWSERLLALLGF
ncbi:MAG: FAD-binding oxidoreductase, partial [Candidatus Bathyarchaeota archaeon]